LKNKTVTIQHEKKHVFGQKLSAYSAAHEK